MSLPGPSERSRDRPRMSALLDERSAALARRDGVRAAVSPGTAYVVCTCDGERYGLPLTDVAAVIGARPCVPLPGAPPALAGIVALSGRIVTVIDLARALGIERRAEPAEPGHLVRLRAAEPPVALAVDRVVGIAHSDASAPDDRADAGTDDLIGFGAGVVSSYAPPGPSAAAAVEGGFSIIDLTRLLRRFVP